ncbi:hypothetical protein SCP_0604400 [Sparassis crispa]|uniref:Terpene synthase n=1 Tax=Sparassis crispa TaxID=139825 RepID=A0A401GQE7_9APHY|nr:hypothetical protein SCP_0604400 [Sparassis crispa]GBE84461.1 hypothetical protein SCP_0604400 [Sparassis crispa]
MRSTKLRKILSKISLLLHPFHKGVDPSLATPRSKEDWLGEFKGSQVMIPDLYALLPGWRFAVNKHYETVRTKLDEWMLSWVDDQENCRRMKLADFAMLAGCFYPDAEEEEYLMAAYYHLWVFVWDDELDCGPLTKDLEKVAMFKKETDECLNSTLGSEPFNGSRQSMTPMMKAFCDVAEKVAAGSTPDARSHMLHELIGYVDSACALPYRRSIEGDRELFSRENFLAQRARSGGAGPSLILPLYIYHLNIPSSILDHESLQTIFTQACLIVHLINDIVSFVKELRDDQLDNIVPVLAIEHRIPLQAAIERACELVCTARQTLEDAEKRLPLPTGNEELDKQLLRYVQGCKDVAAGNLHWSYQNARYFGSNPKREGNKIFLRI